MALARARCTGALRWGAVWLALGAATAWGAQLTVGPGKQFGRVEEAAARARPGDVVLVYPGDYQGVAVFVRQKGITFTAAAPEGQYVKLSGKGFNYSGAGSVPRAIFQFNKGTDGCRVEGFELCDARNDSFNGAAVRINQANDVTVLRCNIHDCDMGIMSNGDGTQNTAVNQRIEGCLIHSNGTDRQPGYNHNLYLGGTSVTVSACEIFGSVTGHNLKSRAHQTRVEYCYIHDSANRELDLVDAKGDTDVSGSDAILVGNVIAKDRNCPGNRAVIHFGQDGGKGHDGTIYLAQNTVMTPFRSPVIEIDAAKANAVLVNDIIWDGSSGQAGQVLLGAARGGSLAGSSLSHVWLSGGFRNAGMGIGSVEAVYLARPNESPLFANPAKGDWRLGRRGVLAGAGLPWKSVKLPALLGATADAGLWQYMPPLGKQERDDAAAPALGAYELAR